MAKNVLVIGKGGREHAIIRALQLSPQVDQVHVVPGSAPLAKFCICHSVEILPIDPIIQLIQRFQIQLVIVGPEQPLTEGLADALRERGVVVFGPSKEAAQLESSKSFAKEFMKEFQIPTASYFEVQSVEEALRSADNFQPPYVFKVDGLAAGKGVFICENKKELKLAAQKVFEEKIFGDSGNKALLEEFQEGWELSFFILTNGEEFVSLPLTQDHKRLYENDKGPNTGGMGVVGPLTIEESLYNEILDKVIRPTVLGLKKRGFEYKGVLYVGLMMTSKGPTVIEYNVRFGDPEAQVLFPLCDCDWGEVFDNVAQGKLQKIDFKKLFVASVVLASEGYPEKVIKGAEIQGDIFYETSSGYFLFAGVGESSKKWVAAGGRVLNAVGIGSSLKEAVTQAYKQASQVTWKGLQIRKDIGQKVL